MYQSQRQRGIQNLEAVIKGQTTQIVNDNGQCPEWPKRQKNKVANNDRDLYNNAQNRNATKRGGVRTWVLQNGRSVSLSCSTCGTRCQCHVTLDTNPVMNQEGTGLWIGQIQHICGQLICDTDIYSVTVNQVMPMVATVKFSKWWLQLSHLEPLVQ